MHLGGAALLPQVFAKSVRVLRERADMEEVSTGTGRRGFGRRRIAPRVGIVDPKPYVRTFLAETFEDLGFVPECWATAAELLASLNLVEPDLVVIVLSDDEEQVEHELKLLAAALSRGRTMLIGSRSQPALARAHRLGEQLGLVMVSPLGTPFRTRDLKDRIADLIPVDAPPPLPVDLVEALGNDWLELWYQAKIDPRALAPLGAEALIRLRHPSWGIVRPAHFLPEKGDPHFRALSDFVVLKAMADWMRFAIDSMPIEIAINLPAVVLADPDFVRRMRRQVPSHPAFNRLVVEIDSSEVISDVAQAREIVRELNSYGIGISIDNLGTECSSLAGLEEFPVFELKVARQIVNGCAEDRLKRALCRTILDIARRIGARTVAEGVETRADLIAVREMGFDLVQGFLFGKPREARKFARTLRRPISVPC
jgi:EAL domain-containing protein (putative c-di-GMP-specific phosphodiesterase class I)/CheY-like chemotaxis protein